MKPWMTSIIEGLKRVLSLPAVQDIILRVIARVFFGTPAGASVMASVSERPLKISSPESIRKEVQRLNLLRSSRFDALSPEAWAKIWNGWGPDDWPYVLRAVITWIERYMEVVAGPHDEWYDQSDGTAATWRVVMDQWTVNTRSVLNDKFPMSKWWLWPVRAAAWVKAEAAIAALEKWSFAAWVSAHEKNDCFG